VAIPYLRFEKTIGPISRVKNFTFEMGPMGCPEKSVKITTAICVITLKIVVLIYCAVDNRSQAGERKFVPLCGNFLGFFWDSAEKPCDGQYIFPELYP